MAGLVGGNGVSEDRIFGRINFVVRWDFWGSKVGGASGSRWYPKVLEEVSDSDEDLLGIA